MTPEGRQAACAAPRGDWVAPMRLKACMEQGASTHQVGGDKARRSGPPLWLSPWGHCAVPSCEMAVVWAWRCAIMRCLEWARTS